MEQEKKRPIIDFHTHTFPDKIAEKTIASLGKVAGVKAQTNGTLQGLMESMERTGVDYSVILPVVTRSEQFQSINNFAAQINNKYGDKVHSFGGIHPLTQNYKKELNYIKSLGLKGIKLHPDYQGAMIDDIGYKHIIDYASSLDLVIVVHAGIDIGIPHPVHCPPEKSAVVIDELQPPKLVLAHMGGWKQWDAVEQYLIGKHVYLDTAFCHDYIEKKQFERIVKQHGVDKILFATDLPWEDPKATMELVENASLSETEKNMIYMANACRLLGIRQDKIEKKNNL